ncbi:MAG: TonB-dependent receptor [Blastocatellia bacterium]|jgi:iron complex outermembrane receptor protein
MRSIQYVISKALGVSLLAILLMVGHAAIGLAQTGGALEGRVTLGANGEPIHNVRVTIIQLRLSTETGEDGTYSFRNVPAGRYEVRAHLERTPDVVNQVAIVEGQTVKANFEIRLDALREQITVTASGREETTLNAIASVTILTALELARKNPISLGEALDHELGVAKRSSGPGNSRPVVRGFDGDRVLVLQEGIGIGGLGFQSGDHAEPIDVLSQERIEVLKGPATLLYGSNAIGGVVNAISGHDQSHPGVRGYVTGIGGTTNDQGAISAGLEIGTARWLLWGNGGGQRTTDYLTPLGRINNSSARASNGTVGVGYFGNKGFLSLNYTLDRRNYGVPTLPEEEDEHDDHEGEEHHDDEEEHDDEEHHHHGPVRLDPRRQSLQLRAGFRDLTGVLNSGNFTVQYNDYRHDEIEIEENEIGTRFRNKTFLYRAVFDQQRVGRYSGSFGFSGLHRSLNVVGAEALAPPTTQDNFAAFALQSIDVERVTFQFGGRVERNAYDPTGLRARSFTGFSGSAGMRVGLDDQNVFVANYSHNYRAPALEELYNFGPHPGNLTYEIGNASLNRERSDGIDLSLRHNSRRLRGEANFFYYGMRDFIYLAPTGDRKDGLIEARFAQGNSRFTGVEGRLDLGLTSNLWLLSSMDYVNAELTTTGEALPRIPPLRARVGFEAYLNGLRINPEVIMARSQERLFSTEERTAGYGTVNVNASYTITGKHVAHIFSVSGFNLNNKLFRNHLSLIKEIAPEIGRGVRFVYTLRFF